MDACRTYIYNSYEEFNKSVSTSLIGGPLKDVPSKFARFMTMDRSPLLNKIAYVAHGAIQLALGFVLVVYPMGSLFMRVAPLIEAFPHRSLARHGLSTLMSCTILTVGYVTFQVFAAVFSKPYSLACDDNRLDKFIDEKLKTGGFKTCPVIDSGLVDLVNSLLPPMQKHPGAYWFSRGCAISTNTENNALVLAKSDLFMSISEPISVGFDKHGQPIIYTFYNKDYRIYNQDVRQIFYRVLDSESKEGYYWRHISYSEDNSPTAFVGEIGTFDGQPGGPWSPRFLDGFQKIVTQV